MAKKENGGFLLGALLGAAVAGVTALLYAPKSGEELRKSVSKDVDDLIERAREYKDYAVERGVEMYDSAAEVAAETSEDIKLNVQLKAENLKTQLNELKEEGIKLIGKKENDVDHLADEIEIDANQAEEMAQEFTEEVVDNVQETAEEFESVAEEKIEEFKD